eukprot:883544-Amphidinium_carterae.3
MPERSSPFTADIHFVPRVLCGGPEVRVSTRTLPSPNEALYLRPLAQRLRSWVPLPKSPRAATLTLVIDVSANPDTSEP